MSYSQKAQDTEASGISESMGAASSASSASFVPTAKQVSKLLNTIFQQLQDSLGDPDFSAQAAVCLFIVAQSDPNNPPGVLEMGKMLGLPPASSSRLVSKLGRSDKNKEGLGLLELTEDPSNWSRKLVRITPKGIRLIETLGDRLIAGMKRI